MRVSVEAGRVPIKMFTEGVFVEDKALEQVHETAQLPFIYRHVAVMPDVHWGIGASIGSVVPTKGAIVPAAVGVDIGCGMMAARINVNANDLRQFAQRIRDAIEAAVPHGRNANGGVNDIGSHTGTIPALVEEAWIHDLQPGYDMMLEASPNVRHHRPVEQLGTLGTGNHFIEVCLDENDDVWIMLHSGSRGPGNTIGTRFITEARKLAERYFCAPPNKNLAWLPENTAEFHRYMQAVHWAQKYAQINRELMMNAALVAIEKEFNFCVQTMSAAVNCHHNYVARERHFGEDVWVTRKGAVRARRGDLGIIPGSMGERSFIVQGKGNSQSFHSCSHGAGRVMSRKDAKKTFTVADHEEATKGIACRKDEGVLDETPKAYKDLDAVMAAQADLVEVVHTLRQIVCVKG